MIFRDISFKPNVNGGPRNCIPWSDTSVYTNICCLVCIATTISDPVDIRSSPAVFVARLCHAVRLSCDPKRISNGSCVPIEASPSHPKAMTCLSWSDTIICLAIVGASVDPDNVFSSTAREEVPDVLSQ